MSYNPNQQPGYPPYQPPPNQYPQSNSPYPPNQQQNWNQPPHQQYQQPGYPQQPQPYGAPPNQQPPYGAPPNQQPPYGAPPNQQPPYGAPPNQYGGPPNQYGAPPNQYGGPPQGNQYQQQQSWNQPPPHQYPQQGYPPGPPPPGQPPYGAPPNQYGAPPQPYGAPGQPPFGGPGPFGEPSPGYGPNQTAPIDVSSDVQTLRSSMKGWGTKEDKLIQVLSKADPIRLNTIRTAYNQGGNLISDIEKDTSGNFEKALVEVARGPLVSDCHNLREAVKGLGTKEAVLNDVLIGRTNADINAIKNQYQTVFLRSLDADLQDDLSAATKQMFQMIIAGRRQEESAPVNPQQINQDVKDLQAGMGNMISKDATQVCQILTNRSDAQIRAITQAYQSTYHKSLDSAIKSKFSGHMEDALRLLVARANNKALSDAVQLEETMAGLGTKDQLLIQRLVRAHWNRQHMHQVSAEYERKYGKKLVKRIKGETSGSYEKMLVACME